MNERIKELAEQAGMFIANDQFSTYGKFAELIIDECCLKLLDMDEKARGNNNYYKHAALEIKKHFRGE
jgi:hypothetical protein